MFYQIQMGGWLVFCKFFTLYICHTYLGRGYVKGNLVTVNKYVVYLYLPLLFLVLAELTNISLYTDNIYN